MSTSFFARLGVVAAAALTLMGAAQAASINSATATFTGTTELITFDGYDNLLSSGQYLDGDGDVLFSSDSLATLGADNQDLGQNGLWGARVFGPTGTGEGNFLAAFSPILFNFGADGPQQQVGAYMNLFQGDPKVNSITLTAYGESMNVLETFSVLVNTDFAGYNEGRFLGFSRASADIYNFGISGGTIVLDNLTLSAVPEPEALVLMMVGVLGLAATRRHNKR